jgi:hypothetical protein
VRLFLHAMRRISISHRQSNLTPLRAQTEDVLDADGNNISYARLSPAFSLIMCRAQKASLALFDGMVVWMVARCASADTLSECVGATQPRPSESRMVAHVCVPPPPSSSRHIGSRVTREGAEKTGKTFACMREAPGCVFECKKRSSQVLHWQ